MPQIAINPVANKERSGMRNPHSKTQRGQGMVEYIIIVAPTALAASAAFPYFGSAVRGPTAQTAKQVAGVNDTQGLAAAQTAADSAVEEAKKEVGLNDDHGQDQLGSPQGKLHGAPAVNHVAQSSGRHDSKSPQC